MFSGFHFATPYWLLGVLAGPLVILLAVLRERHGAAVVFPTSARLRHVPSGWRVRLRFAPVVLAGLGLSLCAVALARPQKGSVRENVTTEGVDIVIALDISGSMQ